MPKQVGFVVAVDGPAASGKGTLAAAIAENLNLPHLDTGLLYRAVAILMRRSGEFPDNIRVAPSYVEYITPQLLSDPTLRSRDAGDLASRIAVDPMLRRALLHYQKSFATKTTGVILDGRDIGTVITPDAPAKLFVTAEPEVRAARRWRQLVENGSSLQLADVIKDIATRDARDRQRSAAPLIQASDAVLLDTTRLSLMEAKSAALEVVLGKYSIWRAAQKPSRSHNS